MVMIISNVLYKMSIIKKDTTNVFSILFLYNFKSFKKNLRFKRYNLGITKFIKNRKKYNVRKRKTSNFINYIYFYTWSKLYIILKQFNRFIQLQSLSNYLLLSRTLKSNLISLKLDSNLKLNYTSISKNIFFNLTLFPKINYYFYRLLFFSENITIILSNKLDSSTLLQGVLVSNNNTFKLLNSNNNIQLTQYFFVMLIDILFKQIINILIVYRKLFILNVLSQKFLK